MDLRVEWSPEALEDIEALADYISRDSEFYARSVVSKDAAQIRVALEQDPGKGARPGLGAGRGR
ncbi:MAG: hypothetical protein ACREA0_01280 [bacterium]